MAGKQTTAYRANDLREIGADSNRREEYHLGSRVEQRADGKVFIKYAVSDASRPFLDVIAGREEFAAREFHDYAEVVVGRREHDSLVYPFVEAPNLEQQIGLDIKRGCRDFALDTVLEYSRFLGGLPQVKCIPTEFYDFIAAVNAAIDTPLPCLAFGPYDCIPRNLIRNAFGWKVLDLEWTFPFPIPVDFLLWRGIYSLIAGLQHIIQSSTSREAPIILYRGYGRSRVYMPFAWYKALNWKRKDLIRFGAWDSCFARAFLKPETMLTGPLRLSTRPRMYTSLPRSWGLMISCEELIKCAVRFIQIRLRKKASRP